MNHETFIHIHDLVHNQGTPGRLPDVVFGKSPVAVVSSDASKPARKVAQFLSVAQEAGIVDPGSSVNGSALTHEFNNCVYSQIVAADGSAWFVHARVLTQNAEHGVYATPVEVSGRLVHDGRIEMISGMCLFGVSGAQGI